ncbi:DUF397 domain-containing protein [Streptomyces cellulosae]
MSGPVPPSAGASGDSCGPPAVPECCSARPGAGTVHVRDSKAPDGPRLTVTSTAWSRFVTHSAC